MELKIQTHKIIAHRNVLRRSTRGDAWLLQYDVRPRTRDTGQPLWLLAAEIPLPLILDYSLEHYATEQGTSNEPKLTAEEPDAAATKLIMTDAARTTSEIAEAGRDAEGREREQDQGKGGEAQEEPAIYCICRRGNFGRMVACDNEGCEIEWFHFRCVGLRKTYAPKKWLCPACKSLPKESIRWRQEE